MSKGILNEGRVAICPTCGVEFIAKRINQKHCSDKCRIRSAEQRRYQKVLEEKKNDPPRHCKCCGKRLEGRQLKFCSPNCKKIFYSTKTNGLEMVVDISTSESARCECTRKEECDYGINCSGTYICGYMLMEGHPRGTYADGDKCEFFKERSNRKKRWCDDVDEGWG